MTKKGTKTDTPFPNKKASQTGAYLTANEYVFAIKKFAKSSPTPDVPR